MQQEGGIVAGLRDDNGLLVAYLTLYPRHADYAELGWLHAGAVTDTVCITEGVALAKDVGLRYLIAFPTSASRAAALCNRGFVAPQGGLYILTL